MTNAPVRVVPSPHLGSSTMMLAWALWMAARNGPAAPLPGDCCGGPEAAADGVLARARDANTRTAATDAIMRGEALRIEFPLLMPPYGFSGWVNGERFETFTSHFRQLVGGMVVCHT